MAQYMTIAEAAKELGVTITTLRRWDTAGRLRPVRASDSGHRKYPRELITRFKAGRSGDDPRLSQHGLLLVDKVFNPHDFIQDPASFERFILSLAVNQDKLVDVQNEAGPNDLGVDIIGYTPGPYNRRDKLVYIQCKFIKVVNRGVLDKEVDKLRRHIEEGSLVKPDRYIIACACNIGSKLRRDIRNRIAQEIGETEVVFWAMSEIDQKLKSDRTTYSIFIAKPSRAMALELEDHRPVDPLLNDPEQIPLVSPAAQEEYDAAILRASELIQEGSLEDARTLLFKTLGRIESLEGLSSTKARLYNNLGVTYLPAGTYRNLGQAMGYFAQALEHDPKFETARTNELIALANNSEKDRLKAWRILKDVSKVLDSQDPKRLGLYLELLARQDDRPNFEVAIQAYKKLVKQNVYNELLDDDDLRRQMAFLYLEYGREKGREDAFEEAEALVEQNLAKNAEDPVSLYLKAVIKIGRSSLRATSFNLTVTPKFDDPRLIQECVDLLQRSLENIEGNKAMERIRPDILYNLYFCKSMLSRFYNIHIKIKQPDSPELSAERVAPAQAFQEKLDKKKFSEAYEIFHLQLPQLPAPEIKKIAEMFAYYGAPDYSIRVLRYIEEEHPKAVDSDHWMTKSLVEVLERNKAGAITAAKNAVMEAEKESKDALKRALSHQGAVLIRYPKEGDSLLRAMLEFDKKVPENGKRAVRTMDFEKDQDEIVKMLQDRREWLQGVRDQYLNEAIPTYALEKLLKMPFIEVWSQRTLDFPFYYLEPGSEFVEVMSGSLRSGNALMLDYQALLTLSKTKLLGFLDRLGVRLVLHFKTFQKVQDELIRYENEDLRRLWDYLRQNQDIEYIFNVEIKDDRLKKLDRIFDEWLCESMQYCFDGNATLVVDDLRLLKLVHESTPAINSFALIQEFVNKEWVDAKRFSQVKYELADCLYTFLPFNAEDLHEAVWLSDYKHTRGVDHYINQMHLPGSDIRSFLTVFGDFIMKLWSSGALVEDKVRWLLDLSNEGEVYFKEAFRNNLKEVIAEGGLDRLKELTKGNEELMQAIALFGRLWRLPLAYGTKEDLRILQERIEMVLLIPEFEDIKKAIKEDIASRLNDESGR